MVYALSSPPLVSVIIPTYNRELLVERAVRSVLDQQYTNFELIIVDDGSTDGTADRIMAFNDERIRLIRHETSKGPSAARNTGLQHCSGSFIAFLDSDDSWLPGKLEKQLAAFAAGASTVGLVYTGTLRTDNVTSAEFSPHHRGEILQALLVRNVIGSPSAVMISKEACDVTGFFDERLNGREDLDYWIRLCEHFTVEFVDEPLTTLLTHEQDRVSFNTRIVDAYLHLFKKHLQLLKKYHCCTEHIRRGAKFLYEFTGKRNLALRHLALALKECPLDPAAWINYLRYSFKWR